MIFEDVAFLESVIMRPPAIFVCNFDSITEDEIRDLFPDVVAVKIGNRYAFVLLESLEETEKIISGERIITYKGRELRCNEAKYHRPQSDQYIPHVLYICNIPDVPDVKERLEKLISPISPIVHMSVPRVGSRIKGYAIVDFENSIDAGTVSLFLTNMPLDDNHRLIVKFKDRT